MATTLEAAPSWVATRFDDPWPDGDRIDSYLSSEARAQVIRMLKSDAATAAEAQKLANAGDIARAFDRWGMVFARTFPAYS
jgi:hypothetical protein